MSIAADAGRLLLVGCEGTTVDEGLRERLRRGRCAGVILFARNVSPDPEETAALCAEVGEAARGGRPAIIAIDQEGGRVARLREPATEWPPMAAVGRLNDVGIAYAVGQAIGRELAVLGIGCDFAPVLDVHTNPANPVIGDRALSSDPAIAARVGVALARGLEDVGVAACGKHFPGHGDTAQDSHLELPSLPHDLARLRAVELVPFAAAARAGIAMIMTAHVLFPALDAARPATLSPRVLDLLRGELGYQGVIVSDDLEMRAVADQWPIEDSIEQGLLAGCDLFLICRDAILADRAYEQLVRRAEADPAIARRVRESAARVGEIERRFARTDYRPDRAAIRATLGAAPHRALAERLKLGG